MPVVHIYTPEGWLSPARKKLMVESVTRAVVEAEGVPQVKDMTYVIINEVPDGGWCFQGKTWSKAEFSKHIPPDPR